jgi:hypothetical protein
MKDCIDCGAPIERGPDEKDIGDRCMYCWNLFTGGDPVEQAEMYADDPYYADE